MSECEDVSIPAAHRGQRADIVTPQPCLPVRLVHTGHRAGIVQEGHVPQDLSPFRAGQGNGQVSPLSAERARV